MKTDTGSLRPDKSPEFDFLCRAVGRALGFGVAGEAGFAEGMDGERLIRMASAHRCVPLLARACDGADGCAARIVLPSEVRARLLCLAAADAGRELFLARQLVRLMAGFGGAGIEALAWKGPAMAKLLYGQVDGRSSDDLDIWVHPRDFPKACAFLEQQGFQPLFNLSPVEAREHRRAGWDRGFQSPGGDYMVELCVAMAPRYFARVPEPESLLAAATDVDMDGAMVRTLGGAALMELLCLHGMKHGWTRLGWVADVAALSMLQGPGAVDWDELEWRCRRHGTRRMTDLGLALARLHLGAPIERGYPPSHLIAHVSLLLSGASVCRGLRGEMRLHMQGRERWRDKFRYAGILFLMPGYGDWRQFQLPAGLFWLHWLFRPFRLARMACRKVSAPGSVGEPSRLSK